jgi:hypothetical protein
VLRGAARLLGGSEGVGAVGLGGTQTHIAAVAPDSVSGAQWKLTPLSLVTTAVVRLKAALLVLLKPATNWLRSDAVTACPALSMPRM